MGKSIMVDELSDTLILPNVLIAAHRLHYLRSDDVDRVLKAQDSMSIEAKLGLVNHVLNPIARLQLVAHRIVLWAGVMEQERPRSRNELLLWLEDPSDVYLVNVDNQRLPPDAPVSADDVQDLLDIPAHVTLFFNHNGSVPAQSVVDEAISFVDRAIGFEGSFSRQHREAY